MWIRVQASHRAQVRALLAPSAGCRVESRASDDLRPLRGQSSPARANLGPSYERDRDSVARRQRHPLVVDLGARHRARPAQQAVDREQPWCWATASSCCRCSTSSARTTPARRGAVRGCRRLAALGVLAAGRRRVHRAGVLAAPAGAGDAGAAGRRAHADPRRRHRQRHRSRASSATSSTSSRRTGAIRILPGVQRRGLRHHRRRGAGDARFAARSAARTRAKAAWTERP